MLNLACSLQACSLSNSTASVRTFQRPEETLEESLLARGVNAEGYTFLGKASSLGILTRGRSMHVANSKFYVRGTTLVNFHCVLRKYEALLCKLPMQEYMTQQVKSISMYENYLTFLRLTCSTFSILDRSVTLSLSVQQRIF